MLRNAILVPTLVLIAHPLAAEDERTAPAGDHIVVEADRSHSALAVPVAAAKTDVPLGDLPQSVQVVPRALIEDRRSLRVSETLDTVSAVEPLVGYGDLPTAGAYIRGFRTGSPSHLRDGFQDFGFITPRDLVGVERVEVWKGPASVLYGAFQPGGVINTVSRLPPAQPVASATLTGGGERFLRPEVDLGGPLGTEALRGRIGLAYERGDSYRDHVEHESWAVAPRLGWNIAERTDLTVIADGYHSTFVFDRGLPVAQASLQARRGTFLGEPSAPDSTIRSGSLAAIVEHRFAPGWSLRQGLSVAGADGDFHNRSGISVQADGRTVNRAAYDSDERSRNHASQTELTATIPTGPAVHHALVGVEVARSAFAYDFLFAPIAPIDLFDPVYSGDPAAFSPLFAEEYATTTVAPYVQDVIRLGERVTVTLGARYDRMRLRLENRLTGQEVKDTTQRELSPRAGLLVRPLEDTSLFASWSRAFNPLVFGSAQSGSPFEPETADQIEAGVRQELLERTLSATATAFVITKRNVVAPDPGNPPFSIQTGEQRSRGVELDLAATPIPGWSTVAAGAWLEAEVTRDTRPQLVGQRLVGVPERSASLWTSYEIQSGRFRNLGAGLGAIWTDERAANLPNTVELPSYVRFDAMLSYRWGRWRAQLSARNLTDELYYESAFTAIMPQAPLTVLGTLQVSL